MPAADDFADLMPHRLKVTVEGALDDYGYPVGLGSELTYMCLVDDTQTTRRNKDGVELMSGLVAYVNAVPIDGTTPVEIKNLGEKIELVTPALYAGVRPVTSISRHYDETGLLHNMEVRFS